MSQATITGKVGPALTLTAAVITNIRNINLDCDKEILTLTQTEGKVSTYDVSAQTTWTLTVSGNNYTLTVA